MFNPGKDSYTNVDVTYLALLISSLHNDKLSLMSLKLNSLIRNDGQFAWEANTTKAGRGGAPPVHRLPTSATT